MFTAIFVVALLAAVSAAPLNVHLVAHTHDDVGWLKTVDQYYYGANNTIQDARVQFILDTVIECLRANPNRKFIYVEIAYFSRWWREQDDATKEVTRQLVRNGQLEFINAGGTSFMKSLRVKGWVMSDEGVVTATDIIDQMTLGHDFIMNELGVVPTVGWHIDPFGHSASNPALFANMGFNGFFFARVDYQDYANRVNQKALEFVWRGVKSYGTSADIFSYIMYKTTYCFPGKWIFENPTDLAIQDDPRMLVVNIKQLADEFVQLLYQNAAPYRTNEVLISYGCDFKFSNAFINFKNMDKLMNYINSHPEYGINLFYSTPSIYLEAVHNKNLSWPLKTDDFFPIGAFPQMYWTGYFSSRSALKGYVRSRSNILHTAEQVLASSGIPTDKMNYTQQIERIYKLADAQATAQHHDAVTGTSKQHVAYDYAERLSIGTANAIQAMTEVVQNIIDEDDYNPPVLNYCEYLNESNCQFIIDTIQANQVLSIVLVNPLAWTRQEYVRIPVPTSQLSVLDETGAPIASQILPNEDFGNLYTVVFLVTVPPLGFTTVFLDPTQFRDSTQISKVEEFKENGADYVLENDMIRLTFDGTSNLWTGIENLAIGESLTVNQGFYWYNASAGNEQSSQASGAYVFRPNSTTLFPPSGFPPYVTIIRGELVQEVRQVFAPWLTQSIRLYAGQEHVELEATIGPIPIGDGLGKEIIRRYNTSLNTNQTFYSDANGMEMQLRKWNYRPTWNFTCTIPVSCNYVPVTSMSFIRDEQAGLQFSHVEDRSRGGTSAINGAHELMLHRRLLHDDAEGVHEPLNESTIIRTKSAAVFDLIENSSKQFRTLSQLINSPLTSLFGAAESANQWISNYQTTFKPMVADLPPNVRIETFKMKPSGEFLLRLAHLYADGEDENLSQNVTVDIGNLFTNLQPISYVETSLTGNQPISEMKRLQWNVAGESKSEDQTPEASGWSIVLTPMSFRTFLVRYLFG